MRYNIPVRAMLKKTISKKFAFVTSLLFLCFLTLNCSQVSSSVEKNTNKHESNFSKEYEKPQIVGEIKTDEIKESSGIAASRCNKGIFWTHNDSGDYPFIYALNAEGEKLGTWWISGAKHEDWEDMATLQDAKGECFLYIGDIGNNKRLRGVFTIYKIKEPKIVEDDKKTNQKKPRIIGVEDKINFEYPDIRHDAETLMIHPKTGEIYILTKRLSDSSGVYKLSANYAFDKTNKLEKVADFTVPAVPNGLLTGGDISPDGKRIVICDYFNAYEIALPDNTKNFDEIWKAKPLIVELGKRKQGEAVCYSVDGNSIFATSEKENSPIIEAKRKSN